MQDPEQIWQAEPTLGLQYTGGNPGLTNRLSRAVNVISSQSLQSFLYSALYAQLIKKEATTNLDPDKVRLQTLKFIYSMKLHREINQCILKT